MSNMPTECNGEYVYTEVVDDYTTTNNGSQGLDLRITPCHEEKQPLRSCTRKPSSTAVKMETDDSKDTKLPLLGLGCDARILPADKAEDVAKWIEEQCEFTQSSSIVREDNCHKPKNDKPSARDKLIRRISHPFTQGDKKRLEGVEGQVTNGPTCATLTDVQHSDFVQGRYCAEFVTECVWKCLRWFCTRPLFSHVQWTSVKLALPSSVVSCYVTFFAVLNLCPWTKTPLQSEALFVCSFVCMSPEMRTYRALAWLVQ